MLGRASVVRTLDTYGHLMNDDLTAVATALGSAIDATAVSLRSEKPIRKPKAS
jgi:hypothetical protein